MKTSRRRRILLLAAGLAALSVLALAAAPRELLSMRPPEPSQVRPAPARDLSSPPDPAGPGDEWAASHAVRLPVTPHRVRLGVDKTAAHPLDHPVPVRREGRLPERSGTDRRVRVFAVNEPSAPPPAGPDVAASEPPAVPVAPSPSAPPATAPAAVATAAPAPVRSGRAAAPRDLAQAAGRRLAGTRLLVVGDSLSISLADVLERRLATSAGLASFSRLGKVSSGLARPDFFDWEAHMDDMARKSRPDVVVVMIGANDNKAVRLSSGKLAAFGTPAWAAEYRRRATRLVEIARTHNPAAQVLWVGAPVMADPGLARDMPVINAALAEEMGRQPGCRFVDVWPVLAGPGGGYAEFRADGPRLRTPDGVHLAPAGAALLGDACLAALAAPAKGVMLSQLP